MSVCLIYHTFRSWRRVNQKCLGSCVQVKLLLSTPAPMPTSAGDPCQWYSNFKHSAVWMCTCLWAYTGAAWDLPNGWEQAMSPKQVCRKLARNDLWLCTWSNLYIQNEVATGPCTATTQQYLLEQERRAMANGYWHTLTMKLCATRDTLEHDTSLPTWGVLLQPIAIPWLACDTILFVGLRNISTAIQKTLIHIRYLPSWRLCHPQLLWPSISTTSQCTPHPSSSYHL